MTECTCHLLPCICTADVILTSDLHSNVQPIIAKRSRFQELLKRDAIEECVLCTLLPCICDSQCTSETSDEQTLDTSVGMESDVDCENTSTDGFGRVPLKLVESSGDETRSDPIYIASEIAKILKNHQCEGVRFLVKRIRNNVGCILADYMGLGKSLQVITAIHSYLTEAHVSRLQGIEAHAPPPTAIIMCPTICIASWRSEFKKWLNLESTNFCSIFVIDTDITSNKARIDILKQWKTTGGVLIMGYELFRSLLNPVAAVSMASRESSIQICTRMRTQFDPPEAIITNKALTKKKSEMNYVRKYRSYLCDPGPDIVVLDEGHRMKHATSILYQSLSRIKSKKRIILTGYPLQNSLSEYFCMINFCRENYLDSYDHFRSQYELPIMEGKQERLQELVVKLRGVVLRRGKELLVQQLPPKLEWILSCKLSNIQYQLYLAFLGSFGATKESGLADELIEEKGVDMMTAYSTLLQVMNHPDLIFCKLQEEDKKLINHDPGDSMQPRIGGWGWEPNSMQQKKRKIAIAAQEKRQAKRKSQKESLLWAQNIYHRHHPHMDLESRRIHCSDVKESGKMVILLHIVAESVRCGDKIVIFSQSVPTLHLIQKFLRQAEQQNPGSAHQKTLFTPVIEIRGSPQRYQSQVRVTKRTRQESQMSDQSDKTSDKKEWFLQIDGSTTGSRRLEYIERFTDSASKIKVLLISTRAGAEGINLHAANRLILFDSMCRSHRIGQTKPVYIYRLVSTGTMERMMYDQQKRKVDLSDLIVDRLKERENTQSDESKAVKQSFLAIPCASDVYDSNSKEDMTAHKNAFQNTEQDLVLSSCIKNAKHWLASVYAVPSDHIRCDEDCAE